MVLPQLDGGRDWGPPAENHGKSRKSGMMPVKSGPVWENGARDSQPDFRCIQTKWKRRRTDFTYS